MLPAVQKISIKAGNETRQHRVLYDIVHSQYMYITSPPPPPPPPTTRSRLVRRRGLRLEAITLCVCAYVCACVHVACVCAFVCVCVCAHVCMCVCVWHVCVCMCVCVACVCVHVCVGGMCVCACMSVCLSVYMYASIDYTGSPSCVCLGRQ